VFDRIVVGVSKAESAQEAAQRAVALAQKFDAELHLVIAYSAKDADSQSASLRHAEGTVETIAASHSGVGNKGMHGAGRVLGSVPNDIAHKATCSVLIVSTT
jgi:nucleotide-binding universal stress UspA family protein